MYSIICSNQMPEHHEKLLALSRLREEIRRIERRPARRDGAVRCNLSAVDFPRGALSELSGGPASGKTAVALSLLAALAPEDLFAWVDGRGELYPPAASALGVDLARLLVVRPSAGEAQWLPALWACEALLSSGAFAAVAMDVPVPRSVLGAGTIVRKLKAAAEIGGAVGLWLSPSDGGLRVGAAVRLEISSEGGRIAVRRAFGIRRAGGGDHAA